MPEKKWVETIHKEIDGLNSTEESSKLKVYLVDHPEENKLYLELLHLSTLIKNVETPDPSPALKKNILSTIPYNLYPKREMSFTVSLIQKLRDLHPVISVPKLNLRYASAFAVGFVFSMILFFVYQSILHPNMAPDSTYLQGTIGLSEERAHFLETDKADIRLPGLKGGLQIFCSKDIIQAALEISSTKPVEVVVGFDKNNLVFDGFRFQAPAEQSKMTIDVSEVTITHAGDQSYWMFFNNKAHVTSTLQFKIFCEGSLIYEAHLKAGEISNK